VSKDDIKLLAYRVENEYAENGGDVGAAVFLVLTAWAIEEWGEDE